MNLLYVVGAPGAGKSTLMAELTAGAARVPRPGPPPHDQMGERAAELGRRREGFSGTDALSMSIQPVAVRWITGCPFPLVLGEGARLANTGFLLAARRAGYTVTLPYLDAPAWVLDQRCTARGSAQNGQWRRGAATRAARIAALMELDARVLRLDATRAPADLAAEIRSAVPALEELQRA
jgi:hypothetical protein